MEGLLYMKTSSTPSGWMDLHVNEPKLVIVLSLKNSNLNYGTRRGCEKRSVKDFFSYYVKVTQVAFVIYYRYIHVRTTSHIS